jgi:NADPH2:quinone reductase
MILPDTTLQIRSLIRRSGELELSLQEDALVQPAANEVVVRVEAAPINPSDQGLLFGGADLRNARAGGTPARPIVTAPVPEAALKGLAGRVDQSMRVGNEGAGVVVAAGASAQALLGKTVAMVGGAMYSQYRRIDAAQCMALPPGATPAEGASAFINPLTALGMVETMRREGHKALVHTAAASNLGQMLNRICIADGIGLVNIVRRQEQEDMLRALGAKYVCNAASPGFMQDLTDAIAATGATLAFDATGGGKLAGQILNAMEAALNRATPATEYSRYGSTKHKQVYLYGSLERGPTEFTRGFGMAWGMGGWLLFSYMRKIGAEGEAKLKARVAAELKTTFASRYTRQVSMTEALSLAEIAVYSRQATGEKYLLNPNG